MAQGTPEPLVPLSLKLWLGELAEAVWEVPAPGIHPEPHSQILEWVVLLTPGLPHPQDTGELTQGRFIPQLLSVQDPDSSEV